MQLGQYVLTGTANGQPQCLQLLDEEGKVSAESVEREKRKREKERER